jgi:hypothetical protein
MATSIMFREFDRSFNCIASSGSSEYDLTGILEIPGSNFPKPVDKIEPCLGRKVDRMSVCFQLLFDAFYYVGVRVTNVQNPNPCKEIEERIPVYVTNCSSTCFIEGNWNAFRVGDSTTVDFLLSLE